VQAQIASGRHPRHRDDKNTGGAANTGSPAFADDDDRNCSLCRALVKQVALVQRFTRGVSQPLDLVLDHQFSAFQFDNLQIVCGKMHESFVQFIFENLVFSF
jgi:hypothetical protein